jgi:hypothetical protein
MSTNHKHRGVFGVPRGTMGLFDSSRAICFASLIALASIISSQARAAAITSSALKPGSDVDLIVISGDIGDGDSEKFRQLALGHKSAVVFLDSNGGSTLEAIEIGKLIRIAGYPTYVSSFAPCNSACSLIWLAGSKRLLGSKAAVGFHATYVESNGKRLESGVGNAIVGSYLNQINLDERAVIFATSTPPDQISYLTLQNLDQSGISAEEVKDNKANENASSQDDARNYGSVGSWKIAIDDTLGNGCFAVATYDDGLALRVGYDARASLTFYVIVTRVSWKSIVAGSSYDAAIQLDQNTPWSGKFHGIDFGGLKGLYIPVPIDGFLPELSKSSGFQLYYEGKEIDNGELTDIAGAVNSLRECQSRQGLGADPFAH